MPLQVYYISRQDIHRWPNIASSVNDLDLHCHVRLLLRVKRTTHPNMTSVNTRSLPCSLGRRRTAVFGCSLVKTIECRRELHLMPGDLVSHRTEPACMPTRSRALCVCNAALELARVEKACADAIPPHVKKMFGAEGHYRWHKAISDTFCCIRCCTTTRLNCIGESLTD